MPLMIDVANPHQHIGLAGTFLQPPNQALPFDEASNRSFNAVTIS